MNNNRKQGIVLSGVAARYEVGVEGHIYTCTSRMNIKKYQGILFVGDRVEISVVSPSEGVIEKLYDRRNYLLRPPVANIDRVLFLISTVPEPDFSLLDKFLVFCSYMSIDTYIVVNKADLGVDRLLDAVNFDYGSQVKEILAVSILTGENVELLKARLSAGLTCLVGQSAVGKSSLLNSLSKNEDSEVGEISVKSGRGKHTTRKCVIKRVYGDSYIIDTPGFSFLSLDFDYRDLKDYYVEFNELSTKCKYHSCLHINEPDCAVKRAVVEGKISKERYDRYIELYNELENTWRKKYD